MVGDSTSVEDPWSTSTGLSLLLTAVCRKSFWCVPHPHEKNPNISISAITPPVSCFFLSSPRSHRVILGEHDRQSNSEQLQVKSIAKVSNNIRHKSFFFSVMKIHIFYLSFPGYNGIILAYNWCSPLHPGHLSPILQRPELQQWHHPSEAVIPSTDDLPCVSCVPGLLQHQHPLWNQMRHQWMGQDRPNLWVTRCFLSLTRRVNLQIWAHMNSSISTNEQ